jgi:TrmH family RNA methyltransferase
VTKRRSRHSSRSPGRRCRPSAARPEDRRTNVDTVGGLGSAPVAAARRLLRHRDRVAERRFLAEGPRAVAEALAAHRVGGHLVHELFCTQTAASRHPGLIELAGDRGVTTRYVTDRVADALSDTRTPQGVVAVCAMPAADLASVLAASPRLLVVLVEVADPGNAGTVIRVADAAGAHAVVFAGTTVDPYNGKCVRASAGSLFHLPVVTGVSPTDVTAGAGAAGLQVLAADAHAEADLDAAEVERLLGQPTCWLFGHEVRGLTGTGLTGWGISRTVRVPTYGRAESLNLATAAAVCLYASARAQRRSPAAPA